MGQQPSTPKEGAQFRVIGAGMCRTGTKTLNEALKILLDGPCHDSGIQSLGGSPKEVKGWLEIMDLAPKARTTEEKQRLTESIRSIFTGYVATMDCPAASLVPEIMEAFPDAIVLVTTRDQTSWWKSMQHMNGLMSNWYMPICLMWLQKSKGYGEWGNKFQSLSRWRYGSPGIREHTKGIHEEQLRKMVPPEKLFWYDVKEGWEPLCRILNLPVPDRPFPHNNSKLEAEKSWWRHVLSGFSSWIFVVGIMMWLLYYTTLLLDGDW
ncbi:hypothetical protein JX265_011569 [Neoarthrinium moseri]|uniref:NAD dependent epimerase/dehydratase n=1 Tax=Neoarthrinium moseri TaxID=1658444 RepID=A0A9P9WCE8_9PEZI|nr:uncharacterized protein JN550_011681 [Neoarthrinium moseri]KAI1848577.1 hypothetical protein JX266_005436 [Neoarthrinium moseri]KAI1856610.1 hypothetical protein JX265_011569 [Neoarthrinium moseri]KAI1859997.1 hypothetical protein JN550_011681 [Neoarthrinium moseri]